MVTDPPQAFSPSRVAGGLHAGIPKAVEEVTDMKSINFAQGHNHKQILLDWMAP